MIIEFELGDEAQANLLEHELTRPTCAFTPSKVLTVWQRPGTFRLVGDREELRRIVEERWAKLPELPPAKLILAE